MASTVLVVTALEDITADRVIAALNEREVPVARVDPADIGPGLAFGARIGAGAPAWTGRLVTGSREVELGEVAAVYYRRPTPYAARFKHLPTLTCSSPRPPPAASSRSATSGSTTCSACPPAGSARTASSTRPRPPAATPDASATCSACPSERPSATPAPSTSPGSSSTASAMRDQQRVHDPSRGSNWRPRVIDIFLSCWGLLVTVTGRQEPHAGAGRWHSRPHASPQLGN